MAAIRVHHTATDDRAWDGPANEGRLRKDESEAYYKSAFAWQDPEGDPKTKGAYRFIHHLVDGGGDVGAASTRACSSAIGVLNGGRGGTTIPDADRRGVYNHLAAHLKDADMTPPDLRESGDSEIERRTLQVPELRVLEENGVAHIVGYAALFDVISEDLGFFREMIRPGAFTRTLKESADVRALWNHEPIYVLGRTRSGTLKLEEDARGLRYDITPPETQWAQDVIVTMRRGDVNQSSFSFRTISEEWGSDEKGILRSLTDLDLLDVSPVTFPAYPQTSAQVRSRVFELSQPGGAGQASSLPAEVEAEARARRKQMQRLLDLAEKEI